RCISLVDSSAVRRRLDCLLSPTGYRIALQLSSHGCQTSGVVCCPGGYLSRRCASPSPIQTTSKLYGAILRGFGGGVDRLDWGGRLRQGGGLGRAVGGR